MKMMNENENTTKPSNDVTHINTNNLTKKLVKNLSKNIKTEGDLTFLEFLRFSCKKNI